ncbi:hypothetical protein OAY25_05430 [Candidatus Pelagibacter sp.]|nr:hypothetical protein [Candidatus Pelagibacter sp.]
MGFWFKYNLSLVFNNGYVFDSGMMNSNDIDGVLILSIYIFLTVLLANFTSKKNNYDKFNIFNKKNIISKIYFRFKYLFIASFIIFILFTGFINYHYKIYIKGLIFENDLNFIFVSLIKWLLLYGLVVLSCFILNQEIRKKNNNHIILITFLIFFEMFVSFTSMLSRSIILFALPFLYSFIIYQSNNSKFIKNYFKIIIIYFLFTLLSIYISNHLRLFHVNKLKQEVKVQYQKLNEPLSETNDNSEVNLNKNNFENAKKFDFQINEILTEENTTKKIDTKQVTSFILINRWVGIDSLINISRSDNLSFEIFFDALNEQKSKVGNSFYETKFNLENKKPSFYSNNIYVKGNTLPGLFTFLYYSGNKIFLLFSIFIIVSFFIFLEKKIYYISNKNFFFIAFFSHCIANRIFSFGYAPKDTYLFIFSLLLSVMGIYFLETSRFDKIFKSLK